MQGEEWNDVKARENKVEKLEVKKLPTRYGKKSPVREIRQKRTTQSDTSIHSITSDPKLDKASLLHEYRQQKQMIKKRSSDTLSEGKDAFSTKCEW